MAKKKAKKRKKGQASGGNALEQLPRWIKSGEADKIVDLLPQIKRNEELKQKYGNRITKLLREKLDREKDIHPRKSLKLYDAMIALYPDSADISLFLILLFRSGWKKRALDTLASLILDEREKELDPVKEEIAACLISMSEKAEELLPQNSVYLYQMWMVQDALYAYEEGDVQKVKERLKEIGHRSPYRSWKLLLKGIMAFDAGEDDNALGYFGKCLGSPVSGIARFYLFCIESARGNAPTMTLPKNWNDNLSRISRLSSKTFLSLCKIESALKNNRIAGALKIVRELVQGNILPKINETLYHIFKHHILQKNARKWDNWLPKIEALLGDDPRDPQHLRFIALCEERIKNWEEANSWWQVFLDRIYQTNLYFDKKSRNLACALVLRRMAKNVERIEPEEDGFFLFKEPPSPEKYLKKSLKYDPKDQESHKTLLEIARIKGKPRQVKKCVEYWLKSLPEDTSALMEAAHIYMGEKNLKKAQICLEKVIKLDPLNRKAKKNLVFSLLCDARLYAFWRKWKIARQNFEKALAIEENLGNTSTSLCKWAAFEYLAGNEKRGQELIEQALAGSLPGYVYFVLTLEMVRFGVSSQQSTLYLEIFKKNLQSGLTGEEAAKIVELAAIYELAVDENKVNELAQKLLVPYFREANPAKFSESELLTIARYLLKVQRYYEMEKLVRHGKKKFPRNYHFTLYLVLRKFEGSLQSMNGRDCRTLERVGTQAAQAGDIKTETLVNSLITYYQMTDMLNMFGFPKKSRPDPPSLSQIIDEYLFS